MAKPIISSDSHVVEPPECFSDEYMEKKYLKSAPRIENIPGRGDIYVIEGLPDPIPIGVIAAAGIDPKLRVAEGVLFSELHRGGWDPSARLADQDKDGIAAEFLYATVGMMMCLHPDYDYKKACFDSYNRWLERYCSYSPKRLMGLGLTAIRSPEEAIREIRQFKEMGFKGVMMPGNPRQEDYHHPMYNPLWEAAIELDMPLSFHILTSNSDRLTTQRGPKINAFHTIMRGNQDIIGTFIYGGVFDRYPDLKIVCVEADAGWVPHFMYRMDHAFEYHSYWMKAPRLEKMPSEYFRENIYLTFQDDWVAFKVKDLLNLNRLMWANDFPHSDSTWPRSQEILAKNTVDLTEEEKNKVLHDNISQLYSLDIH